MWRKWEVSSLPKVRQSWYTTSTSWYFLGHLIGLDASTLDQLSKTGRYRTLSFLQGWFVPELQSRMKELISNSGLCSTDCECFSNGIPCVANVCLCIHNVAAHECSNSFGKVVFNAADVHAFRCELLCKEMKWGVVLTTKFYGSCTASVMLSCFNSR